MATVQEIKRDLVNISNGCNNIVNSTNDVINTINGCSNITVNSCIYPIDKLTQTITQIQPIFNTGFSDIASGLERLLKDLIKEIQEIKEENNKIISLNNTLKPVINELYKLVLLDMEMEGFLEYDLDVETDVKIHVPEYKTYLQKIKQLATHCIYWNNQIIVKVR